MKKYLLLFLLSLSAFADEPLQIAALSSTLGAASAMGYGQFRQSKGSCTHGVFIGTAGAHSFAVPAGCSSITVEAIGSGGTASNGYGVGGGAYAKSNSIAVTPGQTVYYYQSSYTGNRDSWVNVSANSVPSSSSIGALAKGAPSGDNSGGQASLCVGNIAYSGGSGGTPNAGGTGGGGGAGGPFGAGKNGGDGSTIASSGSGGGGGAGGSSSTDGTSGSGTAGGIGGSGPSGTSGGFGATIASYATDGSNGSGGGGGFGNNYRQGGYGSVYPVWGSYGPSGGNGGNNTSTGGAGGGADTSSNGIVVITY
ncbi:MAG: hypothetical protein WCT07_03915 [Candidatus Paceibacterota bacterium]